MAFPSVTVECAFSSILGETNNAQTGYTDITRWVDTISGTLRGRSYELDQEETGSISLTLDNADGRFTPGSSLSPYYPYVKANRRLRIRGNNMQQPNVARGGGSEGNTQGFFLPRTGILDVGDNVTVRVSAPVVATHDPVALGFTGALLTETKHIEGRLANTAHSGYYNVVSYYVPIELGVRLTHSAYVWKISGTEPAGTNTIYLVNSYYDATGTEIAKIGNYNNANWSATPTTPTRRVFAELPPNNAAYCIQSVAIFAGAVVTTDIVYGITGIQTELPTANLAPSISGYVDEEAWEMTGGGTVATGGTTFADAYVLATWAANSVELTTTIPHLIPGDDYTLALQVQKNSSPDIYITGNEGLSGTLYSVNTTWTTLRVTFTATASEQRIRFIPQGAVTGANTLWLRQARVSYTNASLPLAVSSVDTDETAWTRPIALFEGWVERWPIKTTARSSAITITVDDRMKRLGQVIMASTIEQTLITDDAGIIIPFTDSPDDSHGRVSTLGNWPDDSGVSQLTPSATKFGPGAATFALGGFIGPTDEDAVKLTQVSMIQGYSLAIPYSADYGLPGVPITLPTSPVPSPPGKSVYSKRYYAIWSRAYDASNATRSGDPSEMYQGASLAVGDTHGNTLSMFGFNYAAIVADLTGATVSDLTISLYALYWYNYAGGTVYLGTHTNVAKPATFVAGTATTRRWVRSRFPLNQWRTIDAGAAAGVQFQTGAAKGIVVGAGDSDHESYGYFGGAANLQRPYITITFKK
jgi:hypothetical protein